MVDAAAVAAPAVPVGAAADVAVVHAEPRRAGAGYSAGLVVDASVHAGAHMGGCDAATVLLWWAAAAAVGVAPMSA